MLYHSLFRKCLFAMAAGGWIFGVSAYDGSNTWLNYTSAADAVKAGYSATCVSLVISNPESDTLKNARREIELGMKGLLGKALTAGTAAAAGAIVLAPEGSPLVAAASIDYSAINVEGFIIKSAGGATYISGKTEVGVLRGVFHFLRLMQMGRDISNLNVAEKPYFAYRVLDHWWSHYGSSPTVERVYGGDRIYKMENFGKLGTEGAERTAVINYCRMAASLGLNGITPDNVNTSTMGSRNYTCIDESNIKNQKVFADLIGTYGLKYFLSISYVSPQKVAPQLSTSDPSKAEVVKWWDDRVKMIKGYISNFGGFLMKADSEGEAGPRTVFNQGQAAGAEPLAKALGAVGATLIWRTFIYTTNKNDDFAVTQMDEFDKQTWNKNVILRMKDGPRDFQVVEPPNFVATYGGVRHGMELQVTQEYTGQDKHICWLVPKWKKVFDWNMVGSDISAGVKGTMMHQILAGDNTWENGGGIWGISNLSDAKNWTGHYIHQANAYGFGRLTWNPLLSEEQIAEEWIRCSFQSGDDKKLQYLIGDMLHKSYKTFEDYTMSYSALMPAVCWNEHYEIEFDRDVAGFRTPYFMNLTSDGIGVDRTAAKSTFLSFLPKELADSLGNIAKCPEDYLLFFHHCKWEYKMKSGMTLIQSLHHNHFRGIRQVKRFINNWKLLQPVIDGEIYSHVLNKLNTQLKDASTWAATFKSQFGTRYSTAVGCDLAIQTSDDSKAVVVQPGETVALSALFADQKGTPVTETINWKVTPAGIGGADGTIDAATGVSTNFTAATDGIYIVTASTATWPDLKDELQIFVGDWDKVGARKKVPVKKVNVALKCSYHTDMVVVSTPFAGDLEIVGLNGRVVTSITVDKAGPVKWNTASLGSGLYLVRLRGIGQDLRSKVLIR